MFIVTGHCFIMKIYILRNMLHQNGYPHRILDNCVNKFLNSKLNPEAKDQNIKNGTNRRIALPYVCNASSVFKKLLSPSLRE